MLGWGKQTIPDYMQVQRKKVKYARIRINPDATVTLTVPHYYRQRDIDDLIQKKSIWINQKREQCQQQLKSGIAFESDTLLWFDSLYRILPHKGQHDVFHNQPETLIYSRHPLHDRTERLKWYRRQAKKELSQRLESLAGKFGLQYQRVAIRDQKTRWGSCSSRGTISLNWRLIMAPEYVCHYVLIHELAHTRHMNHSKDFWQLVEVMAPGSFQARVWLKQNGQSLMNYI